MRIPRWRGFLGGGLAAMAVYFLLPDTDRVTAAFSAGFHCGAAVAVAAGIRHHRPTNPRPWYLIAAALAALGIGNAIQFATTVQDLADLFFLGAMSP